MRELLLLLLSVWVATSLVSWLGWRYLPAQPPSHVGEAQGAGMSQMPFPEDGKVLSGIYINDYFDLSYPLPEGWTEGLRGPDPSDSGYYVLTELVPRSEPSATILVAAQDMFFASKPPPTLPRKRGRVGWDWRSWCATSAKRCRKSTA